MKNNHHHHKTKINKTNTITQTKMKYHLLPILKLAVHNCSGAVVLNERQRVAKRKLIEENRERRHAEAFKKSRPEGCEHERDEMTDADKSLIADIVNAFHSPQPKKFCPVS